MNVKEKVELVPHITAEILLNCTRPVYLAAPYHHKYKYVMVNRMKKCDKVAHDLVLCGIPLFSPCTYNRGWDPYVLDSGKQPICGWYEFDIKFMKVCEALIIYTLPGLEFSKGVSYEYDVAEENNIPIYRLDESRVFDLMVEVQQKYE